MIVSYVVCAVILASVCSSRFNIVVGTMLSVCVVFCSQPEWKLWAKANRIWSYAVGKLHSPLGEWLMPIAAQRHQHFAYIRNHRMSQRLYLRCDDSYALCEPVLTQPNTFVATEVRMSLASIPVDAQPAEVQSTDNLLQWRVLSAQ